jgi:copper ion binding protein
MSNEVIIKDVISIPGMKCQHCVMNIKRTLSMVPGVKSAETDLSAKKVTVVFDPAQVQLGKLIEAVEKAGYEAFPA